MNIVAERNHVGISYINSRSTQKSDPQHGLLLQVQKIEKIQRKHKRP